MNTSLTPSSSMPSVLLINRVFPPERGATGRILHDLVQVLHQNGWRVTVLSSGIETARNTNPYINHHIITSPKKPAGVLGYSWLGFRLFKEAWHLPRHDVVITMTDPPMLAVTGYLLSRFKKYKHVHWCQDLYPDLLPVLKVNLPSFFQNFLEKIMVKSLRKSHMIVAIGHCMEKRLRDKNISLNKITVITNWADFEVISPSGGGSYNTLPEKITAIARQPEEMFRDDSPRFRVLYAGTIGRAHPTRTIIEAAALLVDHKEIEFVFIGDQHAHSSLAKERARRGLENIKFLPFQPVEKLREVLESGDIHLISMNEKALGMVVPCKFYSSLCVGRPSIFLGPEKSEIADVLTHYGAGIILPPDDEGKKLAEAIFNYRHDGNLWFSGQEGALQAAQAHHPSLSLDKWLKLLDRIVKA